MATIEGIRFEAYIFPSPEPIPDFLELIGDDPWWIARLSVVVHFPVSDPAHIVRILEAVEP